MYGVLLISTRSGACLYSKAHRPGFGIQREDAELYDTAGQEVSYLESMSTASMLYALHLQVDSSKGVLACVSMDVKLYGTTAKHICQAILEAFVTENSGLLAQKNPATRAKGFSTSLYHAYEQVPQYIASAIAAKAAPMQLPWVVVAQSDDLLKHTGAAPCCHWWWQLMKKKTAIVPLPPASSQILWTGLSSVGESSNGKLACDSHLPGTCSSFAEVMQIVTKAARRLSLQSYPRHPMDCHVPICLQYIAMPLQRVQEKLTAPVSACQPDVLPSLTEYTPRMVELSIKDTDRLQGSHREATCSSTIENDEWNPNHRLLVMQQNGVIVAVPIRLGDVFATTQQAKAAVVDDVQQLMLMVQCVHDILPSNKCSKPD